MYRNGCLERDVPRSLALYRKAATNPLMPARGRCAVGRARTQMNARIIIASSYVNHTLLQKRTPLSKPHQPPSSTFLTEAFWKVISDCATLIKYRNVRPPLRNGERRNKNAAYNARALAEYQLAIAYGNEEGVQRDLAQAAEWFWKSAEHGQMDGQFYYAEALADGR
jgi:TPR repeat protein